MNTKQWREAGGAASMCARLAVGVGVLFLPSLATANELAPSQTGEVVEMSDVAEVPPGTCGVLHCTEDSQSGKPDIFLSDPTAGIRVNLTRGRLSEEHLKPWGPIGSPDGRFVYMYQYKNFLPDAGQRSMHQREQTRVDLRKKGWLLDIATMDLREIPGGYMPYFAFEWAPDGRMFAWNKDGKLCATDPETFETKEIAEWTYSVSHPFATWLQWSPDGKWIACAEENDVRLVAPDGSDERRLHLDDYEAASCAWSPESDAIATVTKGRVSVYSLNDETVRRFGQAFLVSGWSADGRFIAYLRRPRPKIREIWILSLASGKSHRVDAPGDCHGGTWDADGKRLAFWHEGKLTLVGADGKTPKVIGDSLRGSAMAPRWLQVGHQQTSPVRTWSDSTGQFTIQAKLIGAANGEVRLKRPDGTAISVPLERLSDADKEFVETQRAGNR